MKNVILQITFSLLIISCNTGARYGYRKKVKADNQPTVVNTRTKVVIPKIESIKLITENMEATNSYASTEKNYEPSYEPSNSQPQIHISKIVLNKKIIKHNSKKTDILTPIEKHDERITNKFALLGFILPFYLLLISNILIGESGFLIVISTLLISLILSIIGFVQIKKHPNKYKGKGYAIVPLMIYGLLIFVLLIVISTWSFSVAH